MKIVIGRIRRNEKIDKISRTSKSFLALEKNQYRTRFTISEEKDWNNEREKKNEKIYRESQEELCKYGCNR